MIWILIASIVGCITIAMIVVGSLKLNDCTSCSSAALFLIISGANGCIGNIIAIFIGIFEFSEFFWFFLIGAFLTTLAITIWGSVVVFGKFLDFAVKLYSSEEGNLKISFQSFKPHL